MLSSDPLLFVSHNTKFSGVVQFVRPFTICNRVLLMSSNCFLLLVNAEKKGASSHWGGQDLEQCFRMGEVATAFRVDGRRVKLGRQIALVQGEFIRA